MKFFTLSALALLLLGFWQGAAWAEIESDVVDMIAQESLDKRKPTLAVANKAAVAKKLTLEALGMACKLMPIRVGAVLTGQAPMEKRSQECLEKQLGLKAGSLAPLLEPPARWNVGSIYRVHEVIDVYGPSIQRWFNEHFGDYILSAIDFVVEVKETKGSHGERRIQIIFDGKALPYTTDEGWAPTQ